MKSNKTNPAKRPLTRMKMRALRGTVEQAWADAIRLSDGEIQSELCRHLGNATIALDTIVAGLDTERIRPAKTKKRKTGRAR